MADNQKSKKVFKLNIVISILVSFVAWVFVVYNFSPMKSVTYTDIPITYVGEWIGANDQTKGIKVDGESTFIVSDGISDWEIPFKTGCKAEYLVIDVK